MPKFFLIAISLLICLPGFGQGDIEKDPLTPGGGRVIIRGAPPVEAPAAEVPATPTDEPQTQTQALPTEEDEFINEAQQDRNKQVEQFKKVETVTAPVLQPKVEPLDLMNDKSLAAIQERLKSGVMSNLSDAEVKKMILEKANGHFMQEVFAQFPKLLDIAADVMRSKEALPGLVAIMARKSDLKDFSYICLAIFVFVLMIKFKVVNHKWSFGKRFVWSMGFNLATSALTFYLFYTFFSEEITPTLKIISKHLF